jgi:hypothetical protein
VNVSMRGTMIRQIRSMRIFMAMISCVHYELITGHVGSSSLFQPFKQDITYDSKFQFDRTQI